LSKVNDLTAHSEKLQKDLTEIINSIKEFNKPVAKPDSNISYSNAAVSKSLPVMQNSTSTSDRKSNVNVYGVKECQPNTFKPVCLQKDFDLVSKILSNIAVIDSSTFMDCYCLGKYKVQQPRPILVKLQRTLDVNTILRS